MFVTSWGRLVWVVDVVERMKRGFWEEPQRGQEWEERERTVRHRVQSSWGERHFRYSFGFFMRNLELKLGGFRLRRVKKSRRQPCNTDTSSARAALLFSEAASLAFDHKYKLQVWKKRMKATVNEASSFNLIWGCTRGWY